VPLPLVLTSLFIQVILGESGIGIFSAGTDLTSLATTFFLHPMVTCIDLVSSHGTHGGDPKTCQLFSIASDFIGSLDFWELRMNRPVVRGNKVYLSTF
jgi:hypothetical protein